MPHKPTCTNPNKHKWVNARWINRKRNGTTYREKWATKECKTCGGNLGDAMVKSEKLRKGPHVPPK